MESVVQRQEALREQQLLEQRYLMATYARRPVQFVRGQGMRLFDSSGREYLDFLSGIGVVCLGHADPVVNAALREQAARLEHVGNYF